MSEAERQWQQALGTAYRTVDSLCAALGIAAPALPKAVDNFPLLVPRSYLERMEFGNPADPLLRQVLIDPAEFQSQPQSSQDPLREQALDACGGVIRKYNGRALVVMHGACAVHCRYCFRRHYPYEERSANLSTAIDWLANNESIREVILSGGDPLLVPNQVLSAWFERIAALSHIRAIRIHSRLPVVLPERMTEDLLQLLRSVSRRLVLVIHANHAHEIRGDCAEKLRYLTSNGITILNQSVLLAGVNDTYAALSDLSWQLHEVGVLPYYLHQLDYVTGAMHFAVPDARATQLIEQLRGNLPGFLVPRLVREEPGAVSKSPIYS